MSLENSSNKVTFTAENVHSVSNRSMFHLQVHDNQIIARNQPGLGSAPDQLFEQPDEPNNTSSTLVSVIVPIVTICLLAILTFAARITWKRYRGVGRISQRQQQQHATNRCGNIETLNYEESLPLSAAANETITLSNNRSDMQLVHEAEKSPATRSDCGVDVHNDLILSTGSSPTETLSRENSDEIAAKRPVYVKLKLDEPLCERPKTLKFLAASVAFQNTTVPALKRLPYTPDPDYDQYCNTVDHVAATEAEDKVVPLEKGKMKIRSKPRGLLERRGSNVALTISLKAGEKNANPVTSKSPKPLAYLQQASSPLLPDEVHVKACDTLRLQQEFWEIPMNHPPEKNFNVAGHGTKNRYRSILPNQHSRVILDPSSDDDALSTYINANFIRDHSKSKPSAGHGSNDISSPVTKREAAFIATQGPMANTIDDFWRMTWQENVHSIVMITKLKERKEKCSAYLPMNLRDSDTYDDVTVTVEGIRQFEHFTMRTLLVRHASGESRAVRHYWYTTWMDHETPEKTRGLLELVQEFTRWGGEQHGPAVVHCSAGIGRTGCFIAVRAGCQQLKEIGKVDILRIVSQMRLDRGGMIQTWEQYQFVHQALSRYARILAGENVTTPSTTGSVRSPPAPIPTTPQGSDPPRPHTPKHRRSLSGNNSLPAPKELKVCQSSGNNGTSSSSPTDRRSAKRKPKLRLGKIRDSNTAPSSPLPGDEAPSPRLAVVKSVSSPTIRSPFGRLCLQAKDMNRSASPASSVKFEWPEPGKSPLEDRILSSRARKSDENDLKPRPADVPPSPACNPSPTQLGRFSFDLVATRGRVCNGSNPPSPYYDKSPPGSAKSATPRGGGGGGGANNCSRFVFPSFEGR